MHTLIYTGDFMKQAAIVDAFSKDFIAMCGTLGYTPEEVYKNEAKYLIVIEYLLM